ncbi:MAG: erythromycin esterase family protein [Chlorobi bacterium]|nr:erythromycin esterase family protein [Chlorobiota bacterium]
MRMLIALVMTLTIFNVYCQPDDQAFLSWTSNNAIRIDSLNPKGGIMAAEPFKNIIGDAKVVCLGESRHDAHEQAVLKNLFIRFMIEELGFRNFILEASLPYSQKINDYIKYGKGDIAEIMAGMPGWFLWDTDEMQDIIKWMHDYNKTKKDIDKVGFFGIDIVAPVFGLSQVMEYIKKVDPDYFGSIRENDFAENDFEDEFWPNSMRKYASFSQERKLELKENYLKLMASFNENKSDYIKLSSIDEYELMYRYAYCAYKANEMFSSEKRIEMGLIRDRAMADNALWIINKENSGRKTIISAHNVHIAKSDFEMTGEEASIKGMGFMLKQELGKDMLSIGATFNKGEYENWNRVFQESDENTIEGKFAKLGYNTFIIDIRKNDFDILNSPQIIHGQDFEMTTVPKKSFDVLYFTDNISRSMPSDISLNKYRNMR